MNSSDQRNWFAAFMASVITLVLCFLDARSLGLGGVATVMLDVLQLLVIGVLACYVMRFVGTVLSNSRTA